MRGVCQFMQLFRVSRVCACSCVSVYMKPVDGHEGTMRGLVSFSLVQFGTSVVLFLARDLSCWLTRSLTMYAGRHPRTYVHVHTCTGI